MSADSELNALSWYTRAFVRERVSGTLRRRVYLGDAYDADKVEAAYENSVLTVRVQLAEQVKARKVEIGGDARKMIAAWRRTVTELHPWGNAVPSLPIDDENLPLFTVGQVAATLEVQHAFLRRLVEDGLTLAAIRRVLELEEQLRLLEDRVRLLEAERDGLHAAVAERDALVARLRALRNIDP